MLSEEEQLQILQERYARQGYCTIASAIPRNLGDVLPNVIGRDSTNQVSLCRILAPVGRNEHLIQAESIGYTADQIAENAFFYRVEICD